MVVGIRSPHYLSPRLCPCEDAAVFAFLCPGTLETLHGLCPEIFVSESTPLLKLSGFLSLIERGGPWGSCSPWLGPACRGRSHRPSVAAIEGHSHWRGLSPVRRAGSWGPLAEASSGSTSMFKASRVSILRCPALVKQSWEAGSDHHENLTPKHIRDVFRTVLL